jgi:serine/threonine protein kinase
MGIVFRAQDVLLNRFVALKVMAPSAAAIPNNRARFFREARAAAAIQHDHIVAIYHVGEDQGVPYITMPLLRGESLAARLLREVKLPVREIIRIGRELAEGLAAAHEQGLIHRDIKPANIWLEEPGGRVKVLDFGLARVTGETVELTYQGALVGTPSYMSPEQGRGERAEALSDLFSLGSVLYHMATGMPPFRGANAHDILTALATETPPPIVELDPTLPPDLSKVIAHLLARKPSDRPTAAAVAKMLREVSVEGPPAIPSAGRRRWWPVLIGAAVIAALVLAVVFRFLL